MLAGKWPFLIFTHRENLTTVADLDVITMRLCTQLSSLLAVLRPGRPAKGAADAHAI
ncbi:MAG: hypothetical protein Q8K59_06395 [Nitrosomonas sp.]|nr:hypothetical protein [Nitrosomonas sp.]